MIRENDFKFEVARFQSGRRYNMVPDFAKVALNVCQQQTEVLQRFKDFKELHGLKGTIMWKMVSSFLN